MANAEDGIFAGEQSIGPGQPVCTTNLHDTGAFVIFKEQGTLDTPRGDHNTLGPNFNIALIEEI